MTIKKCKIDGIRKSSISTDDLMKIFELTSTIKLVFEGEKFVNFNYLKKTSDEYIDPGFYPQTGSWEILGTSVELKKYDLESFIKLYDTATMLVAIDIDTSNVGLCNELFESSTVTWYTDYPKLVNFLDNRGYLSTYISENWLSVDQRKFKINNKAKEIIPYLKNFGGWYEVDSLGTTLFIDLTRSLELLYESVQKSLK